jgi:hypothetical protein
MTPFDGALPTSARYPGPARNGTAAVVHGDQALPPGLVSATTRRLLAGWLGLAVGSLVVAGLFAAVAAFARTPVVYRLFSARGFQLALVGHVTFAFTVWFVAFSGALWVYVAWRANYALSAGWSWAGLGVATAGTALLAAPAFSGVGEPYLSDYVPAIDHPLFWVGLTLTLLGVGVQAVAYLVASGLGRRPSRSAGGRGGTETPEALAMAVGALAMLLALGVTAVSLARLHAGLPFGYRLRVLFWGPGHLLQFLHVVGTIAAWLVSAAVAVGVAPPPRRVVRACLWGLLPFLLATAALYLAYAPEALLTNHLVTIATFWGVGAGTIPIGLMLATGWRRSGRPGRLPWGSPVFSGMALSLGLFAVGGVLGIVGFNQDTRVPAHYHGMVGAVTLAYMGLAPLLLEISGRRLWSARVARWQPYLYGLGLLGIMAGMHWAGGHGAPRKTFGFTWANAQALLAMNLMGLGSLLAILGGLAFVLNVGIPLVRRGR